MSYVEPSVLKQYAHTQVNGFSRLHLYISAHTLAYKNNSQRKRGLELESQRLAWGEWAGTWERPEGRNGGMGDDIIIFHLKYI